MELLKYTLQGFVLPMFYLMMMHFTLDIGLRRWWLTWLWILESFCSVTSQNLCREDRACGLRFWKSKYCLCLSVFNWRVSDPDSWRRNGILNNEIQFSFFKTHLTSTKRFPLDTDTPCLKAFSTSGISQKLEGIISEKFSIHYWNQW